MHVLAVGLPAQDGTHPAEVGERPVEAVGRYRDGDLAIGGGGHPGRVVEGHDLAVAAADVLAEHDPVVGGADRPDGRCGVADALDLQGQHGVAGHVLRLRRDDRRVDAGGSLPGLAGRRTAGGVACGLSAAARRAVPPGEARGAVAGAAGTACRGEEEAGCPGGDCGGGPAERAVGDHDGPLG